MKMIIPKNRHLFLRDLEKENPLKEEKENKLSFIIPEELKQTVKKSINEYGIYWIEDAALDCNGNFELDCKVVVENSMVREIEIEGEKRKFILENYVICAIEEEEENDK